MTIFCIFFYKGEGGKHRGGLGLHLVFSWQGAAEISFGLAHLGCTRSHVSWCTHAVTTALEAIRPVFARPTDPALLPIELTMYLCCTSCIGDENNHVSCSQHFNSLHSSFGWRLLYSIKMQRSVLPWYRTAGTLQRRIQTHNDRVHTHGIAR